jgi:hypothetical protein
LLPLAAGTPFYGNADLSGKVVAVTRTLGGLPTAAGLQALNWL